MQDSPSKIHILEREQLTSLKSHFLRNNSVFLLANGGHAARHAEGRGDGREDRDGGLNDEAPYLSFLFIHIFSCWFKGSTMRTFFSSFGFVASRFAGLIPQAEGSNTRFAIQGSLDVKGAGETARVFPIVWRSSFSRRRGRVARGKPQGLAHSLTQGV